MAVIREHADHWSPGYRDSMRLPHAKAPLFNNWEFAVVVAMSAVVVFGIVFFTLRTLYP